MANPLAGTFDEIAETVVAPQMDVAIARPNRKPVILVGCLLAWLGVGGFLSWLIGDFSTTYGLENPMAISFMIFFMFAMSAFLVVLLRWRSLRE